MTSDALVYTLADIAGLAQRTFQAEFQHIDPVIGVNRQMRTQGFAVDILTIDCVVHKNRITLLIEDAKPDHVRYQFGKTDQDPSGAFTPMLLSALDEQQFLALMVEGLAKKVK